MQPLSDLPGILLKTAAKADEKMKNAMNTMADKIVAETKKNLHTSSHKYGTPTPARVGGPPSLISGDLSRSISKASAKGGTEVRIGPDSSPHGSNAVRNRRGTSGGTANSKIGLYLETGLKNGAQYPFLRPAYDKVKDSAGDVFLEEFGKGW
jgi:HK97 gp10 family phage protein